MRKTFNFLMAFLMLIALFTSCEESSGVATMRINLSSDTSRLIAPDDIPLEVVSYHITGSGPSDATFDITTTKTSTSLSGVAVGKWTINATGLNSLGQAIVTGSTTFTLSVNNPSVIVRLSNLVGEGNLSVSMRWNTEVVSSPHIELELTRQNEEESENITAQMNSAEGSASFTKTGLSAGSYILQGRLYSGDILMSGFTEAVRIVGEATSSKEIEFDLDDFPYAPGTIQLLDQSGVPVECTVEGLSSEVSAGEEVTISLVPSRANLKDLTVKWYVDGEYVATGESVDITFQPGSHRLDAVAYTNKIGSYGSCSISFNALVKTEVGVPGNAIRLDTSTTGLKMGANTVMKFLPDGKLMVISGVHNSLQIASMSRNTIDVDKEYGVASLPSLASDPVGMAYNLMDSSGTYAVVVAMNNPTTSVRFNYHSATGEVEQIEACNGIRTSLNNNPGTYAASVGHVGFDSIMNSFVFLGLNTDGKSNYVVERYVPSLTASKDYAFRAWNVSEQVEDNLAMDMMSATGFAVSPDSTYYLIGNADGNVARLGHRSFPNGAAMKSNYSIPTLDNPKYAGLKKIEFSNSGIAYIMGTDYIAGYNGATDREVFFKKVSGASFSDFTINDVTGNIYILSEDTMELYSYPLNSDGSVGSETIIDTLNSNSDVELSVDGSYLILYSKDAASNIELMRIRVN